MNAKGNGANEQARNVQGRFVSQGRARVAQAKKIAAQVQRALNQGRAAGQAPKPRPE
jgi:hypothetical protein